MKPSLRGGSWPGFVALLGMAGPIMATPVTWGFSGRPSSAGALWRSPDIAGDRPRCGGFEFALAAGHFHNPV
ncbi:MAG: hypothetical protein ACE5EX_08390 [Phycisphaerae bacterium]